jgi:hypothetical protein
MGTRFFAKKRGAYLSRVLRQAQEKAISTA